MIVDTLSNSRFYTGISSRLNTAFKWIEETVLETLITGEYPVSDGVYAIVQEYTTTPEKDKKYETHRKYIDIQCVAHGEEMIIFHSINGIQTDTSYDDSKDIALFNPSDRGSRIFIDNKMFAVFFPQDAHIPGLVIDSPSQVLKVVVKVAV